MGPIYQFMGLRVGFVQEGMLPQARREAYQADVTYQLLPYSYFVQEITPEYLNTSGKRMIQQTKSVI